MCVAFEKYCTTRIKASETRSRGIPRLHILSLCWLCHRSLGRVCGCVDARDRCCVALLTVL